MVSQEPKANSPGASASGCVPKGGRGPELQRRRGRLAADDWQLYRCIPNDVQYVPHESFASWEMEERLFGEGVRVDVPRWRHYEEPAEGVPASLARRRRLTAQDEMTLFLRYNYARYRLSLLIHAQRRQHRDERAGEMVRWFRRAQDTRADLVEANLGLVLAMAKRLQGPHVEFSELVSEGNLALLRSVEKFDVSRGCKFSTYACRAILKSFGRLASKRARHRQRFPTEFDPSLEKSDYDVRKHEMQAEDILEDLRDVLARNRAGLTEVELRIIWERFALREGGRRRTLAKVGKRVGLSSERVRQIQSLALGKIRAALEESRLSEQFARRPAASGAAV
jgi:RNA polymerase primary sigma factor